MNEKVIVFRSVTPAQRGKKLLNAAGIRCILQRTPKIAGKGGCSYCLRMNEMVSQAAEETLKKGNIPYEGAYDWGIITGEEVP